MDRRLSTKPQVRPGRDPFRELLERGGIALFDGAMGTMFYSRGVFINRAFEELNLTRPALVREIHAEYVKAGADVLETNSYTANRFRLSAHALADRVVEINVRAAEIAREAAAGEHWVAGAIGPLGVRIEPFGPISREEAREVFTEQARALAEGGVDLFVVETFSHLPEIEEAIRAVREVSDLPVIAQLKVGKGGVTSEGVAAGEAAVRLVSASADVVGVNCSEALATLDALEAMRQAVDVPLAGQPNAGQPRSVQGRHLYLASPEYLVAWARRALRVGARVLGGCCGTTPDHIRHLCQAVREAEPETPAEAVARPVHVAPAAKPVSPKERSGLAGALTGSRFVVGAEMPLPIGWDTSGMVAATRRLSAAGASFLSLPEDGRSEARMPPYAVAQLLSQVRGIEPLVYFSCREKRLARIQSDLLGIWANGLANLLIVTGDPSHSPIESRGAELDVDSIGAVNLTSRLNHGEDIGGNPIGKPTGFHVGVRLDPTAFDREREVRRFYWKVDAGAEFAVTTPVFDLDALQSLMGDIREFRVPVIATVWPLESAREAEFFEHEMVDVPVPKGLIERMQRAEKDGTEAREGLAIARDIAVGLRDHVQGIQIYVPGGQLETALAVLEAL
jgi:homocysteine S-methyltransferase